LARCAALAAKLDGPVIMFGDPGMTADVPNGSWAEELVVETSIHHAQAATDALAKRQIDVLIVDSYAIGETMLRAAAAVGFTAVFRDGKPYGPERVSVNPNPGFACGETVLAGPGYMPLPSVYEDQNAAARAAPQLGAEPHRVLIAFGMRDSVNRTMTALEGIAALQAKLKVGVVIGGQSPHAAAVSDAVAALPCAELVPSSGGLSDVYRSFDIVVGAPGVSQFERACCGLPSILVPQNDRQKDLSRAWAETGAAIDCAPEPQAIGNAINALFDEPQRIKDMRDRGLSVVDGRGAARLAAALENMAG
jgi:spore coat polysaccharide biosynthesis predicted glycosyltransferase SpsG